MDTITLLVSPQFGQQIGQVTAADIASFQFPPVPPELAETTPILNISNQPILQSLCILLGRISEQSKVLKERRREEAVRLETADTEAALDAFDALRTRDEAEVLRLRAELVTIEELLSGAIRAQLDPTQTIKLDGVMVLDGWKVYPTPPRAQLKLIGVFSPDEEVSARFFAEIFGVTE